MKKKTSFIELLKLSILFYLILSGVDKLIAQSPVLINGFPVYLDSVNGSLRATSPIVADFNNDGGNEVLFAYYVGGLTSKIYLLGSNGLPVSSWPVTLIGANLIVTAAGDVDGDGYIDVVLRSADSIYVLDHSANMLPGFPVRFPSGFTKVLLYDLDNNDNLEIVTIAGNKVIVFNSNGSVRTGWPVTLPGLDSARVYTPGISVGDLNDDDVPEIIIPSSYCPNIVCTTNEINIFEPNGDRYLTSPIISDSNYFFQVTPASVYFRNDSGFIAVNSIYEINDGSRTRTSIYNQNGILIKRFYTSSIIGTSGSVSLGDVNNDNMPDISFGYQAGSTYLFTNNGVVFNGWPVDASSYYVRSPLIVNFNDQNLVIATESYADTTGGYFDYHGYIKFFNMNGAQINWSPLRLRGSPETSGTMCDLNKDGILDMVVLSRFYVSPPVFGTMIHAWSFPGVQYKSNLDWPMHGHERYRTYQHGFVPPDEPVGIQPVSTIIPEKFSLYQNYPNPFNPATTIKFDIISNNSNVNLLIYDALGRELETLVNERLKPGTYSLTFDGTSYNSGVYFYKLTTDSYSESKKMLLIK